MRKVNTITDDSAEYNALFTEDGKIDFKSRIGLTKDNDPLAAVQFKFDPRDGRVEFQQHTDSREHLISRNLDLDDDELELNERW